MYTGQNLTRKLFFEFQTDLSLFLSHRLVSLSDGPMSLYNDDEDFGAGDAGAADVDDGMFDVDDASAPAAGAMASSAPPAPVAAKSAPSPAGVDSKVGAASQLLDKPVVSLRVRQRTMSGWSKLNRALCIVFPVIGGNVGAHPRGRQTATRQVCS